MVESRAPLVCGLTATFLALAWIAVALRCWVRIRIQSAFGVDDRLMVVALILYTVYASCTIAGTMYGIGQHVADLTLEDIGKALHFWWLCELFYTASTAVIKLSIALFLLRIAVENVHRRILYAVMAVSTTCSAYFFFFALFQCSPVSFFWDQSQPGHCVPPTFIEISLYVYSGLSSICDLTLGILPIVLVWNLNMNRRTKFAVAAILSVAAVSIFSASCATIVRLPYIYQFNQTTDFLWATTDISIWSNIEPGLGIIASNIATLRPLFRSMANRSTRATDPSKMPYDVRTIGSSGMRRPSRNPLSTFGRQSQHTMQGHHRMEDLESDKMGNNITTIKGMRRMSSSRVFDKGPRGESEEDLSPRDSDMELQGFKIQKTFHLAEERLPDERV